MLINYQLTVCATVCWYCRRHHTTFTALYVVQVLCIGNDNCYFWFSSFDTVPQPALLPSCSYCCLQEIIDWHRPRMQCLVEEGVDFICIETIAARVCAYSDMVTLTYHLNVTFVISRHSDVTVLPTELSLDCQSVVTQLSLCCPLSCH